ncbi:MAG: hypothetical protein JJU13_21225 [Balneolaceae bacterium]|nr:hypothetical protein [Balneolaceae bacterium]
MTRFVYIQSNFICGSFSEIDCLRGWNGSGTIFFSFCNLKCVKEMHRQVGDLKFDEDGLALRGLIVRHLVMPNRVAGAEEIFRFLADEISPDTYVTLMDQYFPDAQVTRKPGRYPEISRKITGEEFREARVAAREAGLHRFDTRWRRHGIGI